MPLGFKRSGLKMKEFIILYIFLVALLKLNESRLAVTTCDRIIGHGYPCENHIVQTDDGYILTVFRIPYSPRGMYQNIDSKPAVLMMHCLLCSSDIWVLNGPNNGLPFLLADAGYDVWIGNVRGNVYSQRHATLSPSSATFWDFALDEIGLYDIPAKIDYILSIIKQEKLHYIGYSQGTTIFMELLSRRPSYSQKIRTSHLLGPVVFICHMKSILPLIAAQFLGRPNELSRAFATRSTRNLDGLIRALAPSICKHPWFESVCVQVLNLVTGWDSPFLNRTLLEEMLSTTPAVASNRQLTQFFQSTISCEFQSYDYGPQGNMEAYGEPHPLVYNLENVQLETPIDVYFSDNDFFVSLEDVHRLWEILGDRVSWHRVKYSKFNHFDFVLSKNVKTVINDCVVDQMQKYEGRHFNGSLCNSFQNKPF